ncbi:hypothetical protein [Streptomyces sp. NPDC048248]|uniref:hypothetical protein n=1 Tax=Streptomyces sp. NPDC048248 TaxID=3365523 RepID=UPI0037207136
MLDPVIETPKPGHQAFEEDDETAAWSRAAQVVGLGLQLAGRVDLLDDDVARDLNVPKVQALTTPLPSNYVGIHVSQIQGELETILWPEIPGWSQPIESYVRRNATPPQRWWREFDGLERHLAPRLYHVISHGESDPGWAATLLYVCQFSHHQIVRVTAAASLASLRTALSWPTVEALAEGSSSTNDTVQQIAVDALVNVAPGHPTLTELRGAATADTQGPEEETSSGPAHTSVIVPGTWTRFVRPSWWRPGEPLFKYLQEEPGGKEPSDGTFDPIGNDLYSRDSYFRWPARFSGEDRIHGARELAKWAASHGCATGFSKLFAHSHGGNVALRAAARHKLYIGLLVLIATPPHERTKMEWEVIAQNVRSIVSLRARFDLVVLLDHVWSRTGRISATGDFPSYRVLDLKLPVWFGHSVLTRPEVWTQNGLAHEVAYEYKMSQ